MTKNNFIAPAFDEIVFEFRNKEYGAYSIRKKYRRNVLIAVFIGVAIITTAIVVPYIRAKSLEGIGVVREEIQVELTMENLDQPADFTPPPPPPPPPPTEEVVQQARYVPPVVVDSITPEEATVQFMTADQVQEEVQDQEVVEFIEQPVQEEIEEVAEPEPFVVVEEMPMFPGGDVELLKYISENIVYPERAKENNVQGRVFVQFAVTSTGTIGEVRILRGVDPELDAEAARVVKTLPAFRPGRQGGKAVPVWYQVPISFQLR
jgi:protein TonB